MRHNVKGRKLGRTSEHRQALFRNQLASLVELTTEGIRDLCRMQREAVSR